MNWPHALLVVAGLTTLASLFTAIEASTNADLNISSKAARNWTIVLFATGVVCGALAAGLWR